MVFLCTIFILILAYTAQSASRVPCPGDSPHLPSRFKEDIASCTRNGIWEVKQPLIKEWIDMMSPNSFNPIERATDHWHYRKNIGKVSNSRERNTLTAHHIIPYEEIKDRQKQMASEVTNMRSLRDQALAHNKNMKIINTLLKERPEWNIAFGDGGVSEQKRQSLQDAKGRMAFHLFEMFQWAPENLFLGPGGNLGVDRGTWNPVLGIGEPGNAPDVEIWAQLDRNVKDKFPIAFRLVDGRGEWRGRTVREYYIKPSSYTLQNWNPIVQVLANLKWKALGPIWEERYQGNQKRWFAAKASPPTSHGICSYDVKNLLLEKCTDYLSREQFSQLYVDITTGERGCGYYNNYKNANTWVIEDTQVPEDQRQNGNSIDRTSGSCS